MRDYEVNTAVLFHTGLDVYKRQGVSWGVGVVWGVGAV